MSIQSERIRELIEQSGNSYVEIERITGIKKSSLQRYASGVTTKIPLEVIEKLATAFNVTPAYLMGWDENKKEDPPAEPVLSEGEKILLDLFNRVPEDKQQLVLQMIRVALGSQE